MLHVYNLPNIVRFQFFLKKNKVKTPWRFDIVLLIWSICLFCFLHVTTMTDSLLKLFKVLRQKMQHTTLCVLRLWWHINTYISSNMALLIARNCQRIIYNKVLENRVKTSLPSISTYNLLWNLFSFKRGRFFLEGRSIAPNAPPQSRFLFFTSFSSLGIPFLSCHITPLNRIISRLFHY